MATNEKTSDNVRAVGRALEILMAFTPQDFEMSTAELLKRVDLSRPTLYRLLYTLQEHGFLVSSGEPQRFRLGPAIPQMANVWTASLDLGAVAEPVLRRIWQQTGETVGMFIRQGDLRMCVAEIPSPQPLNFKRGIGSTERLARGATGRAILAPMQMSAQEMADCVKDTGIAIKDLEAELVYTRSRGYATSHNELISGAVAVAVPFFDRSLAVAGSIGVFGPEVRMDAARVKELAQLLLEEAGKLSSLLGYRV